MKKSILALIFISIFFVIYFYGCGGGENNVVSPVRDKGEIDIVVNWPEKGKELTGQCIPSITVKIIIDIEKPDGTSIKKDEILQGVNNKKVTGIPAGDVVIVMSGVDASGNIVCHRIKRLTLTAGEPATLNAHMGASVTKGQFVPGQLSLAPGEIVWWGNDDINKSYNIKFTINGTAVDIPIGFQEEKSYTMPGGFTGNITVGLYDGTVTNPVSTMTLVSVLPTPTVTPTATATPIQSGPPMVSIPGGTFNMGSNVYIEEQPVHSVTVSSFKMGKYEVTNSDYVLFLNSQGNQTEGGVEWIDLAGPQFQGITGGPAPGTFSVISGDENQPVAYVSWYGTVAYCNWLSSQNGLTLCYGPINNRGNDPSVWRTLNGYRLPTEAEWEYACRGNNAAEYYWGDPYPPDPPNINNYAWSAHNSGGKRPVGLLQPNIFGLYDMSGDITEWCSDWYDANYYSVSPGTNPTGPATGSNRVMRGGSWDVLELERFRSAFRGINYVPSIRGYGIGFRPVRNAP